VAIHVPCQADPPILGVANDFMAGRVCGDLTRVSWARERALPGLATTNRTRAKTTPRSILRDMSSRALFTPEARRDVQGAIAKAELATSAELVVAVHPASGHYRHADYLAGAIAALVFLCVFLYHPASFDYTFLPLALVAVFGLGAIASAYCPPIRRLLTSRRLMDQNVERAARAAFLDLGIGETEERTGILVFVSALERRVEIVADRGVASAPLGPAWSEAKAKLEASVQRAPALERLVEGVEQLGGALASALPRHADDVNELPDEVAA
jgi:putative membrane protein